MAYLLLSQGLSCFFGFHVSHLSHSLRVPQGQLQDLFISVVPQSLTREVTQQRWKAGKKGRRKGGFSRKGVGSVQYKVHTKGTRRVRPAVLHRPRTSSSLRIHLAPREYSQGRETMGVSGEQMRLVRWTEITQGSWLGPEEPEGGRIPKLSAVNRF